MKSLMLVTALALVPSVTLAAGTHKGGHDEYAMGAPAEASAGDMKTVEVTMRETEEGTMIFEPAELSFMDGETVRLVITNAGELDHEFVMDTVEANHALGFKADLRDYGIGIQILKDLGLTEIRLLTNNPKKTEAFNLRGFDLKVVGQVPIVSAVNPHNAAYLATKREKLGHQLPRE